MPFGLTNTITTFMTLMDRALRPCLGKFFTVFLDDILIYNATQEEHIQHLKIVFDLLREHQLFSNERKCKFLKIDIYHLGHVIYSKGISMNKTKVNTIQHQSFPNNLKYP